MTFKVDEKGNYTLVGAEGKDVTFTAGEHSLKFKNGDMEFETDKFVLRKNGKVVVKIEFQKGKVIVVQDGKSTERPLPGKPGDPKRPDKKTDSPTPVVPQAGPPLELKPGTWAPDPTAKALPGIIPFPAKLKGVERWQVMPLAAPSGAFAPSPDGRLVAVVGLHHIHIYDAGSGKLLALGPKSGNAVSWSTDSKWIRTERPGEISYAGWGWGVLFLAPNGTPGMVPPDRDYQVDYGWNPKHPVWAVMPQGKPNVIHLIDPGAGTVREVQANHKQGGKACWSPDGEWLLVVREDKTAQLFARDGKPGRALKGEVDPSIAPTWSPDSKTIAALSSKTEVRLWSVDGTAGATTGAHDRPVRMLRWRPDGKVLAAVGEADRVWFWKSDGTAEGTIETKLGNYDFAWAGDGGTFFLCHAGPEYARWRTRVYRKIGTEYEEHIGSSGLDTVATREKVTRLALNDLLSVEMVEVTGGQTKKLDWKVPGNAQIRFNEDRTRLYVSDESGLSAYDASDPKKAVRFGGPGPGSLHLLAFSPKGDRLAVGSRLGQVTICDATGRPSDAPGPPLRFSDDPIYPGQFVSMAWHPDARHLAVLYLPKHLTTSVAIFDTVEGKKVAGATYDSEAVNQPLFDPTDPDRLILTGARNGSAVWRWKVERAVTPTADSLGSPVLSPDGKQLFCRASMPAVASLDLKTVKRLEQPELQVRNGTLAFAWLPDGKLLAGTDPLSIRTADGKEVEKPKIDGALPGSPSGLTLVPALNSVLAQYGNEFFLLDVKTWKARKIGKIRGEGAQMSPDCKYLVSVDGASVLYWKIETGELAQIVLLLPDRQFAVFSPAGEILASSPDALKRVTGVVENKDGRPELRPLPELKP